MGYIEFPCRRTYTLATLGLKKAYDRTFSSREEANDFMYHLINKYGLRIVEIYDDKHAKTYKCENGERFFIQRAF